MKTFKKISYALCITAVMLVSNLAQSQTTITSIADGPWSDFATWGTTPPSSGDHVIINHIVNNDTMPINYQSIGGSITIGSNGILTGYLLLDGCVFTNYGTFNGGAVFTDDNSYYSNGYIGTNYGSMFIDSLSNYATFINKGHIENRFHPYGNTSAIYNRGYFYNAHNGSIHNIYWFSNEGWVDGTAIFENNGEVIITHQFYNDAIVNGTGTFCVTTNSTNSGYMLNTFDFCDLTGGGVDNNTGYIGAGITFCQNSNCTTTILPKRIEEEEEVLLFPNPNDGNFKLILPQGYETIEIISHTGQKVYETVIALDSTEIDIKLSMASGFYYYTLKSKTKQSKAGKFIVK